MKILNLTRHAATAEQLEAGVYEPWEENKPKIKKLLTFDNLPSAEEIAVRANHLCFLACIETSFANLKDKNTTKAVMLGGAPFLMSALEKELKGAGIKVVYALDGNIKKTSAFKHKGFVQV